MKNKREEVHDSAQEGSSPVLFLGSPSPGKAQGDGTDTETPVGEAEEGTCSAVSVGQNAAFLTHAGLSFKDFHVVFSTH